MYTIASCAMSLDGMIAGPDDDLSWLETVPNPSGDDFGFAAFLNSIDALIMGRRTYDIVAAMGEWPYTKPVGVCSRRGTTYQTPDTFALEGDVSAILAAAQGRGYHRLYIDGGQVIRAFFASRSTERAAGHYHADYSGCWGSTVRCKSATP